MGEEQGSLQQGPWRSLEEVEIAVLEWVWWFNYHRILEPLGYFPSAEYEEGYYRSYEEDYYRSEKSGPLVAALTKTSLRKNRGVSTCWLDSSNRSRSPGSSPPHPGRKDKKTRIQAESLKAG